MYIMLCRKAFSDDLEGVASKISPGGKPPVFSRSVCMFYWL